MKKVDRILVMLGVAYIVIPVILFLIGWIKLPIVIVTSVLLAWLSYKIVKNIECKEDISITKNASYWLIAIGVIFVWVLLSGVGNFSFQTGDFIVRNPQYRDLYMYNWPVVYDLSKESDLFRMIAGQANDAIYVYYFSWWLPSAFVTKIFSILGCEINTIEIISHVAIFIWTVLGLFLVVYFLTIILKRYSYWTIVTLVLFGGFDFIAFYLSRGNIPLNDHIEWWTGNYCQYFEYSSNTSQIYWAFNQAIPIWLIICIFLLVKDNKTKVGWAALAFAYSPYATIGLIPFVVCELFFTKKDKIRKKLFESISVVNVLLPFLLLITYGSFYMMVMKTVQESRNGFVFSCIPEQKTFTIWLLFVIVEFGVYSVILGKKVFENKVLFVAVSELLLIPLYRHGMNNDFSLRVSIPGLFILMIFCLGVVLYEKECVKRRCMMVALCIGFFTSLYEIRRNFSNTVLMSESEYINESVYSFGTHSSAEEIIIRVDLNQYMVLEGEYEDEFFYNYIMKR